LASLSDGKTGRTTAVTGPEAMEQVEEEDMAAGIAAGAGKAGQLSATGDHGSGSCPQTESERKIWSLADSELSNIRITRKVYVFCPFLWLPSGFFSFFFFCALYLVFCCFFLKSFYSMIMIGKQHHITSH
jgi:hypothetical protein